MNLLTAQSLFLEENKHAWRMNTDEGKMFFVQCLHRINIHSCTISALFCMTVHRLACIPHELNNIP